MMESSGAGPRGNPIQRYMSKVGTPSFIFQIILALWTAGWFVIGMIFMLSAAASMKEHAAGSPEETGQAVGLFAVMACPCTAWFFGALLFGILAVVMLRKGEASTS